MRYLFLLLLFFSFRAEAKHPTGLILKKDWQTKAYFEAPRNFAVALPTHFDWRDSGLTDIKDQGQCGSCWAFSTVATFQDVLKLKFSIPTSLSEQYLVSCNNQGWGCNGGFFAHDMHVSPGAVVSKDFPYTGSDSACKQGLSHPYKLASWAYIPAPASGIPAVTDIKNAIYNYGPVSAAVYVDANFQNYSSGIFSSCSNNQSPNHAINIVGWDDAGGYWIMRNSWSSSWGEQGFMRIKYGCSSIGYAANYVVHNEPAPVPTKTPAPPTPSPVPTVTPVPCPAPVADAGPDVNTNGNRYVIVGTKEIPGLRYFWTDGKNVWHDAQILVAPRKTTRYLLWAWNRCGEASDTVIVSVKKK